MFEWVSLIANLVTISGIGFIYFQMKRDGSYASASVVTAICTSVRTGLEGIGSLSHEASEGRLAPFEHAFRNLLNELELAAAIILDGAASGRSGKIIRLLLIDVLRAVQKDLALVEYVRAAVHQDTTFENLTEFIRKHRNDLPRLSAVV